MTSESPCLVALAQRAELIRAEEIRRCRTLRDDAQFLALAQQVSTSVVAAVLRPIGDYLARHADQDDADQRVRHLFGVPDAFEPVSGDAPEGLAA